MEMSCLDRCFVEMNVALNNCPCGPNCPDGCPCPDYNCESPNGQNNTIMVVYNYFTMPVMLDVSGKLTEVGGFDIPDGTGSYSSCSFILNGLMMIVGGDTLEPYVRQISIVESCRMRRIGQCFEKTCIRKTDSISYIEFF